ncbi:MAG: lysylphosphatidylglycerol synthase transmembrane domain-containing protein [Candidatus Tenebribacter burtonii]|nr:lysylphosphatidylglycerol synthase transmembrane domain-containing protein [Candidatus Tenebribacter burtonii]
MKKNSLNWLVGIVLGVIFLLAWIRIVNWQEFLSYFREFDLKMVLIFSIFYLFAYFLRSLRWRIILKPIYKMGLMESFSIFMSGMLINYLIPIRAGEIAKSVILKTRENVKISDSLPSIFIDKLTDLFPIIFIMILIPLVSVKLNSALYIIIGLLFLIFLLFLAFLFFAVNHKDKAIKILKLFLKLIPKRYRKKIEDFFINFVNGMAIMQGRLAENCLVYILTLLAVLSEAIYIYAVFRSFGSEISYLKILFGYTLMNLTYILPTPPAQIGSNQFMWVLIFSFALGVNENLTSAAVTFSHLLTSIWILLTSGISLIALKINLNQLLKNNNKKD